MADQTETTFAHSMTDLMTSLMVIFILLLVVTLNNGHAKTQDTRANLIAALQQELQSSPGTKTVKVEADKSDPLVVIIIPPPQLLNFAVGSAELPPGAGAFLQSFAPRLTAAVCSPRFRNDIASVTVEGHTDPRAGAVLNLELSERRTDSVAVPSLKDVPASEQNCLVSLLNASGRGKADALKDPADYAQDRRVVFKIRLLSTEEHSGANG